MENRIKCYVAAWAFVVILDCSNLSINDWTYWFNLSGALLMFLASIKYKR